MDPNPGVVKSRRYDSSGRRERARRTREQVLVVARGLFLRDGYAQTTVAAIASESAVSAETVYKTFGGKSGLIRSIQQASLAGVGPVPAPARSDAVSLRTIAPHALLRHWATLTTEVAPRVAPINLLVRSAAATDLDMAALLKDITDERLRRMHHNAERLTGRGALRDGMTIEHARDVMFAYTAPELYEILVIQQCWDISRYGDFVFCGLVAQLLPDNEIP